MSEFLGERCAEIRGLAERELASFCKAVTKMFGAEQASVSAHDWIEEVRRMSVVPASAKEWRAVTIRTAARMAARLNQPLAVAS